jgi:protein-tyrosine-phosphatase
MAKVIAQKIFSKKNIVCEIDSCGIENYFQTKANQNAQHAVNKLYNLNLKDHIAKNIDKKIFDSSDLILTMTNFHRDMILKKFNLFDKNKLDTLVNFVYDDKSYDIEDPYGCEIKKYEDCARELYKLITKLAIKINKLKKQSI